MEDKGFGDAVFGEGLSLTLWSGNFTRANPTAPGVFPHFLSRKLNHYDQANTNKLSSSVWY
jgi:hypothetical protein